ncbi:hypothetical protein BVAVS116_D0008 (plasmid) [Borreliella valaisiana VS116]|uniref:Uncharacterized protein n=1 Tax=Borreliella valaisiana VS116 TaxID=445987 RepID=C0R8W3_BORVA|nr:hypothetical protein BVAVS116_D0008 [Borreliella valaisiana VS116]
MNTFSFIRLFWELKKTNLKFLKGLIINIKCISHAFWLSFSVFLN